MHQLAKVHANVERNCWHSALCHYPGITASNAPGLLVAFVRDVIERFRLTAVNLQQSVTANIFKWYYCTGFVLLCQRMNNYM